MITLNHVHRIFKEDATQITAVDDVSLSVDEGEIYGIIGFSGAGKSTLIRMLNGLEQPTSGEILINGEDLNQLSKKELREQRQKIGMIFQHFNLLWSRTVKENILFPLEIAQVPKDEREQRALELIQLVGLEGREDAYPAQLSGGQKQRVGIARSLANDPKILLCDEATSSLDPQTTEEILELLLEINQRLNITIVIITHEMNVIRKICHRVAVMEAGKIIEEGKVIDVFKRPQHESTKQFIRQDSISLDENIDDVFKELKEQFPNGQILSLKFQGNSAQTPIISTISRKYEVDINIIQGNIQPTQESFIGSLFVQLLGTEEAIQSTIQEFKTFNVEVEVIEDVVKN